MISHEEAQALISARLDAPLDPADNRVLLGHLATCASCRRFAEQANLLARGLRDLPQLAPSPVVSRAVLERISQGRSPWARFWGELKFNPAPLAAAVAVIVLLIVGASILRGFGGEDDNGNNLAQLDANTQTARATESATNTEAAEETPTQPREVSTSDDDAAANNEETVTVENESEDRSDNPTEANAGPPTLPPLNADESLPPEPTSSTSGSAVTGETDGAAAATEPTQPASNRGDEGAAGSSGDQDESTDPSDPGQQPDGEAEAPTATATVAAQDSGDDDDGDTSIFAAVGPSDGTPSVTPTPIVALAPPVPATATATATPEPTATAEPTITATPEPTETPRATATSTPEPMETPEPTEIPSPTASAAAEPTNTPRPTETPEPTATREPTETATPAPTETPVPTDTPEPTETPVPDPTSTPEPTDTPEPTSTLEPTPTEDAAGEQPPIVPVEGSDVVEDGSTETVDDSEGTSGVAPVEEDVTTADPGGDEDEPTEQTPADDVVSDVGVADGPTPAAIGTDGSVDADAADDGAADVAGGEDHRIQPIGEADQDGASGTGQGDTGDAAVGDEGEVTGVGGGPDEDSDDAPEPEAFDLADAPVVVAGIPGPASPDGALRYAGGAYVSGVDGGNLAVVTADGAVLGIGPGYYPVWSPGGGQLAYTVDDGVSPRVHVWAGGGGAPVSAPGPEDGAAFRDVPAGWSGEAPVVLRTDRDRAAYAELYVAGGGPFWRREGVGLAGLGAVQVGGGFLVPTTEGWLLVDQAGGERNLGPVSGGQVTAAVVGPDGLLAYLAGGSVWVGSVDNPAGAAPIAAGAGFDFAPSGGMIAVTDGVSLTVYDLGGGVVDAWTPGDGSAVGAPYWNGEGIIVPVGTALRQVPNSEVGA